MFLLLISQASKDILCSGHKNAKRKLNFLPVLLYCIPVFLIVGKGHIFLARCFIVSLFCRSTTICIFCHTSFFLKHLIFGSFSLQLIHLTFDLLYTNSCFCIGWIGNISFYKQIFKVEYNRTMVPWFWSKTKLM